MTPTPFQQAMAEAAMRPMNVQAQLARFERQRKAMEHANQYSMQPSERGVYEGPELAEPMDFINHLNEHFGSPARSETGLPSMEAYDELMAGNKAIADKFEELRQAGGLSVKDEDKVMERLREEASKQYMEAVKNAINRRIGEGGITREDLPGAYGVPYDLRADISDEHPLGYRYKRPSVGRATGKAYYDEVAENVLGRPLRRFNYDHQKILQNQNDIAARIAEANAQQRQQLVQNMGFSDTYEMPRNVYDTYRKRLDAMEAPPTQEELSDIFSYLQTPPTPQYTPPPQSEFERFGRPLSDVQTGEPMDLAFRLLKERKSPEAMRHKLEYDKQYESSPERVKYRTELNRERRRRGIMGSHDHKDVSHTQGGRLTLESEHDNRARHFKNRGTLRQIDEVK
tara:strand:+ start:1648 stop:2844 length:1197 start_codon:yes stop_codon:yes gene_type:complete